MAIIGAHMLFYSAQPEAVRSLLKDAFDFRSVDAGHGWLIFELPPSELGVHPADSTNLDSRAQHQLAFMCEDITETIAELRSKGVEIDGEPRKESYGTTAMMTFPGHLHVMLYEPHHALAIKSA